MAVELTDRELGAFVAEHVMGWEYRENPHGWRLWFPLGKGKIQQTINDEDLPDFCHDLNEVARAEKKLAEMSAEHCPFEVDSTPSAPYPKSISREYMIALRKIAAPERHLLEGSSSASWYSTFPMVTASPRQRCEAMWMIREKIEAAK